MAELRCEGLAKSYGTRSVLRNVDLVVDEGALTAILGASGSGKTTLLRIVMGFIETDEGTVTVGGSVVARAGAVHLVPDKREIGYVAQEGALFPHLSAGENVGFGLPRSERRNGARVAEVLELVGLDAVTPNVARTSCPAASSAASRSPGRSLRARGSYCSTSRSPGSTPRCGSRRARLSCTRWRRRARPPCS